MFLRCLFILVLLILSSARSTDYWVNMGEFNEMGWAGAGTYQPSWPLDKMDMLVVAVFCPCPVLISYCHHALIDHVFNAQFPLLLYSLLSVVEILDIKETSAILFSNSARFLVSSLASV